MNFDSFLNFILLMESFCFGYNYRVKENWLYNVRFHAKDVSIKINNFHMYVLMFIHHPNFIKFHMFRILQCMQFIHFVQRVEVDPMYKGKCSRQ